MFAALLRYGMGGSWCLATNYGRARAKIPPGKGISTPVVIGKVMGRFLKLRAAR